MNIITNPNSLGLRIDADIVCSLLNIMQVNYRVIDIFSPITDDGARGADLNIFLESLHEGKYLSGYASANWLIPNAEWYYPDRWDRYLPLISLILCKTQHAYQVWSERVGLERCIYSGFQSRDMLVDGMQKIDGFIHVCGKSEAKGTDAIAQAWRRLPYPLTLVTRAQTQEEGHITWRLANMFASAAQPIRHLHNLSDDQLAGELSLHRFVIQPSLYEGYGHVIHEAFSAKCAVLTTDAPPMNEFPAIDRRMLIPVTRRVPRMMVEFNHCSADGVARVVESAVRMRTDDLDAIGMKSREEWERGREFFRETFTAAVRCWEEWI